MQHVGSGGASLEDDLGGGGGGQEGAGGGGRRVHRNRRRVAGEVDRDPELLGEWSVWGVCLGCGVGWGW